VALVLVGESLLMFGVPAAGRPRSSTSTWGRSRTCKSTRVTTASFDFAVLTPNWGSQYGLNELNAIDLPFPQKVSPVDRATTRPGLTPSNQF